MRRLCDKPILIIACRKLNALITTFVDDAVEFSFQVSDINQELLFLATISSAVQADEPPGVDALEFMVDKVLDAPFQPVDLPVLFLLH